MYPSIPTDVGVQRIAHLLHADAPRTGGKLRLGQIRDRKSLCLALMRLVLTRNYVQFEGRTYLQKAGTAMGTSLAPVYANLFMASFEKGFLPKLNYLTFYKRYIDDMFAIIEGPIENVNRFQEEMKGLHPALLFTWEISPAKLPFLDVEVHLKQSHVWSDRVGGPLLTLLPSRSG